MTVDPRKRHRAGLLGRARSAAGSTVRRPHSSATGSGCGTGRASRRRTQAWKVCVQDLLLDSHAEGHVNACVMPVCRPAAADSLLLVLAEPAPLDYCLS